MVWVGLMLGGFSAVASYSNSNTNCTGAPPLNTPTPTVFVEAPCTIIKKTKWEYKLTENLSRILKVTCISDKPNQWRWQV